jgi:hypothetical protein
LSSFAYVMIINVLLFSRAGGLHSAKSAENWPNSARST